MSGKERRKGLFIDRPVQGTLVRRLVLHWLLFVAAVSLALPFRVLVSGDPRPEQRFSELFADGLAVFAIMALLLPYFILDSIKLSHRFVGPMLKVRRGLRDLAEGEDVAPIQMRKGDFWSEAADDFNRAAARVQEERKPVAVCGDPL